MQINVKKIKKSDILWVAKCVKTQLLGDYLMQNETNDFAS